MPMPKITPFLWFDHQAEEAAAFYTGIFPNSAILDTTYYGKNAPMPEGTAMLVTFVLDGNRFSAINGGPVFSFNPAVSFVVDCQTQEEIDYYWHKLSEGGEEVQCGWLTDKYGLSWQIVPSVLAELTVAGDTEKNDRMMQALLGMVKLDIEALKKAYRGE
jgi:predicted 3-demethylubiquinone-9 3-methyltransferase (glyoxalase superfamily)